MRIGRVLGAAGVLAAAGLAYMNRAELLRYVRIRRMDARPDLVGDSVTKQGNEAALGASPQRRRADRENAGVNPGQPFDPAMPNLRPGDQAG